MTNDVVEFRPRYRVRAPSVVVERQTEGEYRPGPYWLPLTGGWLPAEVGQYWNWWQMGYDPIRGNGSAMVEACISAYAQTVATCPGDHWLTNSRGGRDRVTTSALYRVLRQPNPYQSISDFLLNLVWDMLLDGNAYALALRNDRNEIDELHLMKASNSAPMIAADGSIFYQLSGNQIIEQRLGPLPPVPSRHVLHFRLKTPNHPLLGESPIMAAAPQMAAGNAALQQQIAFYLNQARPSMVLTTDKPITQQQADDLRTRVNAVSRQLNAGGIPVFTNGIKPVPISINPVDAQLAEMMKLNDQAIANVFRVPLQILGIGGTPFASTQALMQFWLANGLNFVLNHIEETFDIAFKLKGQPDEYTEFDTSVLLRSAPAEQMAMIVSGIRGSALTVNDGRRALQLNDVEGGDTIFMQQQDVPISIAAEPPEPAPPPAPPAPQPPDEDANADARRDFRRGLRRAAFSDAT